MSIGHLPRASRLGGVPQIHSARDRLKRRGWTSCDERHCCRHVAKFHGQNVPNSMLAASGLNQGAHMLLHKNLETERGEEWKKRGIKWRVGKRTMRKGGKEMLHHLSHGPTTINSAVCIDWEFVNYPLKTHKTSLSCWVNLIDIYGNGTWLTWQQLVSVDEDEHSF